MREITDFMKRIIQENVMEMSKLAWWPEFQFGLSLYLLPTLPKLRFSATVQIWVFFFPDSKTDGHWFSLKTIKMNNFLVTYNYFPRQRFRPFKFTMLTVFAQAIFCLCNLNSFMSLSPTLPRFYIFLMKNIYSPSLQQCSQGSREAVIPCQKSVYVWKMMYALYGHGEECGPLTNLTPLVMVEVINGCFVTRKAQNQREKSLCYFCATARFKMTLLNQQTALPDAEC